jgi:uncharacterized membrane protein YhiD involved in acid resistance
MILAALWEDAFSTYLIRLVLSLVLGGVIGFEREYHGRPAGFRTHILVSLSSCLIMLISMYGFGDDSDPARLAAQVITGVGFLGAGAILRNGEDIKGLTTAATLWISSAVGLACGNGFYFGAIATTIMVIILLIFLKNIDVVLDKSRPQVTLIAQGDVPISKQLLSLAARFNLVVFDFATKLIYFDGVECLHIRLVFQRGSDSGSIVAFSQEVEETIPLKQINVTHG